MKNNGAGLTVLFDLCSCLSSIQIQCGWDLADKRVLMFVSSGQFKKTITTVKLLQRGKLCQFSAGKMCSCKKVLPGSTLTSVQLLSSQ